MKTYKVYYLKNKINNKVYFGVTSADNPENRWKELYRHNNNKLHQDLLEYGLNNFDKDIIKEFNNSKEALKLESEFITKYDTTNSLKGYNIFTNKENSHHNSEYLENLSKRTSGKNNPRYGVALSEETRKKISESEKGRILSEETKQKISKANKNKIISEETRQKLSKALKGRQFSEETKKKMSEARKGKKMPKETKEKRSKIQSNMIWINKDGKSSCIQKEDLDKYLSKGWIKGRGKLKKHKEDTSNYSKVASERIWLHKENKKTHCNKNNNKKIIELLNNGWKLGMK